MGKEMGRKWGVSGSCHGNERDNKGRMRKKNRESKKQKMKKG